MQKFHVSTPIVQAVIARFMQVRPFCRHQLVYIVTFDRQWPSEALGHQAIFCPADFATAVFIKIISRQTLILESSGTFLSVSLSVSCMAEFCRPRLKRRVLSKA